VDQWRAPPDEVDRLTANREEVGESGTSDATVGVIGVGHMGGAIARSLLRSGIPVTAFDTRSEALEELATHGARPAASIEQLAAVASIISIVVVDDSQLRGVFDTLVDVVRPGTPLVVHSTVRPETILDLASRATEHGIDLIDAPVTGGAERADLGTLTIMVGGPAAAVRRVWRVFEAIGANVFHVGPTGAGAVIKIVNNLMSYGIYALALEAMSLAGAFGITEDTVVEVLCTGAADSRVLHTWGRTDRTRAEQAGTHFSEDVAKDVRSATLTATRRGLVLPISSAIVGCLPEKARVRDEQLAKAPRPLAPRCSICNQDLAGPFRGLGYHIECAHPLPVHVELPADGSAASSA
jgi:3-hydroxyisobutyrate dehydrogenase-like beta-hydroxyacid dehydrogenase